MRKMAVIAAALLVLSAGPAGAAGPVTIQASPNPALVGQRVVHTVRTSVPGPLDIWVSAAGFNQPGLGTLPPGSWTRECCPAETNWTAAWHYHSYRAALAGTYTFGATSRWRGLFLSTARLGGARASVWVRVQ
ncbi:MAG: hypothetical protein AB1551_06790 [Actinomycetota bacterium]